MNIVFFCQSCGARFEVPPTSAGKKGRCKHCGQMMAIPKAQELASMVAMPALAPAAVAAAVGVGVGPGPRPAVGARAGDPLGWLAEANSNVGLSPLTVDSLPIGAPRPGKPKYDDDLGDSKPYALAQPFRPGTSRSGTGRPSSRPASGVKMAWRKELGVVQKLFRRVNEAAYLVSVPFLLLVLLGAIVGNRPLALIGATAVVLLNLGRIIAGVANLAVVPFRDGIFQGIMFLIPPLTFFYLAKHWNHVKKPTMRVAWPIATVAGVFLAFILIPTLRKDGKMASVKGLKDEIKADVKQLKREMIGEVDKAKKLDVGGLAGQAEKAIGGAAGKINSIGQPDATGKAP